MQDHIRLYKHLYRWSQRVFSSCVRGVIFGALSRYPFHRPHPEAAQLSKRLPGTRQGLVLRGNIGGISIPQQKLCIPNFRAFMPMTYLFLLNFPAQSHWVLEMRHRNIMKCPICLASCEHWEVPVANCPAWATWTEFLVRDWSHRTNLLWAGTKFPVLVCFSFAGNLDERIYELHRQLMQQIQL